MNRANRIFRLILGLGFLPERAQRWLFGTGTRVLEAMNYCLLVWFVLSMLIDSGSMFLLPSYAVFFRIAGEWADEWMAGAAFIGSLSATAGLVGTGPRAQRLAGFALVYSATLWMLLALGFALAYPPLTTATGVYGVLSLFCWLAGEHLMYLSHAEQEPACGTS